MNEEKLRLMTPEEIAAAPLNQSDVDKEIVRCLSEIIQMAIIKAGYIPYIDHPQSHPKDPITEISIGLVRPGFYLPELQKIFQAKGWNLLPWSRYHTDRCSIVVLQTIQQRRNWIKKMWEKAGHRLAPWDLGEYYLDTTYCQNPRCHLKIIFRHAIPREYQKSTEYQLGDGVWTQEFITCPAKP